SGTTAATASLSMWPARMTLRWRRRPTERRWRAGRQRGSHCARARESSRTAGACAWYREPGGMGRLLRGAASFFIVIFSAVRARKLRRVLVLAVGVGSQNIPQNQWLAPEEISSRTAVMSFQVPMRCWWAESLDMSQALTRRRDGAKCLLGEGESTAAGDRLAAKAGRIRDATARGRGSSVTEFGRNIQMAAGSDAVARAGDRFSYARSH